MFGREYRGEEGRFCRFWRKKKQGEWSNARSAPWLQTKTGCLSLLVCYSVETRLTSQLFLIWFLVVAFTKEAEWGLLLSETCTAPTGPGPALVLWFPSFRPVSAHRGGLGTPFPQPGPLGASPCQLCSRLCC